MVTQSNWPFDYITRTSKKGIRLWEYYTGDKTQLVGCELTEEDAKRTIQSCLATNNQPSIVIDRTDVVLSHLHAAIGQCVFENQNEVYRFSTCFRDNFTGSTPNSDLLCFEYTMCRLGFTRDKPRYLSQSLDMLVKLTMSNGNTMVAVCRNESSWSIHVREL